MSGYPMKLRSALVSKEWGGRRLAEWGKCLPETPIGESWEVSTHQGGVSVIENGALAGTPLSALTDCPLLIKLLDAHETLSVQVHPDDVYTQTHENSLGKTEAWVVLEAPPDGKIVYGLDKDWNRETLRAALAEGRLEEGLNWLPVAPGDVLYIPAGLVHGLGEGVLIYEVQQSSDITYRLHDWNRIYNGKPRELHIEKGLEVTAFAQNPGKAQGVTQQCAGGKRTLYIACPYFALERLDINGTMQLPRPGDFETLTLVEGHATLDGLTLTKGDSVYIPADTADWKIEGNAVVLRSYPPDRARLTAEWGDLRQMLGWTQDGLGLGIDTGGTYTDAVLYDFTHQRVLARAKALTTHQHLQTGIEEAVGGLPGKLCEKVTLISLSTTLATNACVENKGCRAALFLFGFHESLFARLASEYGLHDALIYHVRGAHTQQGDVAEEPDWDDFERQLEKIAPHVDAIGIAEYWGVRNPEFEQQAREKAQRYGLPVVCAHDLSLEINSLRRAATTLLNARLIPLIRQLLESVKAGLSARGINGPVMVVRGDGSLMTEHFAMERPVETLLSGPAASVMGGLTLGGEMNGLVVDIGGTTTDIAVVRDGRTVQVSDGVDVGGWRTGTSAIHIRTVGLGGDSLVSFNRHDALTLGPRRAAPLSWLANQHPQIIPELNRIRELNRWHSLSLGEFFYLIQPPQTALEGQDAAIVEALRDGPLSLEGLADAIQERPFFLRTESLESLGIIGRSGLTPTDLFHLDGTFAPWNTEAARMGAEVMAGRMEMSMEALNARIMELARERLFILIAKFTLERRWGKKTSVWDKDWDGEALLHMMMEPESEITARLKLDLPLIAIGAPTYALLPAVAAMMGTRCVVPSDAGVANAVGAITGALVAEETVMIKPCYTVYGVDGYHVHSSQQLLKAEHYKDAVEIARNEVLRLVQRKAAMMQIRQMEVSVEMRENAGEVGGESADALLLETVLVGRGIAKASALI